MMPLVPVFPSTSCPPDSVPALLPDPSPRLATPLVGRESAAWVKDVATADRRWNEADTEADFAFAEVTVRRVEDPVANLAMLEVRSESLETRLVDVSEDDVGVALGSKALSVVEAMLAAASPGRDDLEGVEIARGVDASEMLGRAAELWSATLVIAALGSTAEFDSETAAGVGAGCATDEVSASAVSELVSGGGATLDGSAATTGAEEGSKETDEDRATDGSGVVMGSAELVD